MKRILLSLALLSLASYVFARQKAIIFEMKGEPEHQFTVGVTCMIFMKIAEDTINPIEQYNTVDNKTEEKIRFLIEKEYLPEPSTWTDKMNWENLEGTVTSRFGSIGQEAVFGHRMIYYQQFKDWGNFEKYFVLYFSKALKRPEYDINNVAWSVFEHSNDPKVLNAAIQIMKYAIETWDKQSAESYDTYANLLYKTGNKDLAIEWEQKAVKIKKDAPDEKLYTDNLEKMRKNEPTWPLTSAKD